MKTAAMADRVTLTPAGLLCHQAFPKDSNSQAVPWECPCLWAPACPQGSGRAPGVQGVPGLAPARSPSTAHLCQLLGLEGSPGVQDDLTPTTASLIGRSREDQACRTGSWCHGPWANTAYQRCCRDKHPSSCQGSSVPTISSEWLPADKCPLLRVPLESQVLLRDSTGLGRG